MENNLFSAHLVRGLTDKMYDKRKSAALEIEKYEQLAHEIEHYIDIMAIGSDSCETMKRHQHTLQT